MGILIGYDVTGHRVLINDRVIVARHVDIFEEDVKCIGLGGNDLENEDLNETFEKDKIENVNNKENKNLENLNENDKNDVEEIPELRRSQRNIRSLVDLMITLFIDVNYM